MKQLVGFQRTYLRGLAHAFRPAVRIGKERLTPEVLAAVNDAVGARELIKVAIPGQRTERRDVAAAIAAQIGAECLGVVGGVAIFYRPHDDPEKRRITLPARRGVDHVS